LTGIVEFIIGPAEGPEPGGRTLIDHKMVNPAFGMTATMS
jgi:hypothetical protein